MQICSLASLELWSVFLVCPGRIWSEFGLYLDCIWTVFGLYLDGIKRQYGCFFGFCVTFLKIFSLTLLIFCLQCADLFFGILRTLEGNFSLSGTYLKWIWNEFAVNLKWIWSVFGEYKTAVWLLFWFLRYFFKEIFFRFGYFLFGSELICS